ncbi:MAG: hypothetical protein MJZ64_02370 [Paludibacteraceae bacterium]|nr:hypothetical protein [Paludibacteraceae bacterium]
MNIYHKIVTALVAFSSAILCSAETVTKDTLIAGDSAIVITTICAPICSSVARTYAINKESQDATWILLHTITTPDSHIVFPEAYFENGQLKWRDNTPQLLDDEEKQH